MILLSQKVQISQSHHFTISSDFVKLFIFVVTLVVIYFLSANILKHLGQLAQVIGKKLGTYSTNKDYELQRYVYQHPKSILSLFYTFINEQLLALGLKRAGVSVVGYLVFWAVIAVFVGTIVGLILSLGLGITVLVWGCFFFVEIVMTRVVVSERMEKREADVMNAVDLIVPEVQNGVKNAIIQYMDNFAPSIQSDFRAFVNNIQERGYSFNAAMYILADNLGIVFKDFAQKAIYYEAIGDKNMQDIFTDISETNRLRRQLRDENTTQFASLKTTFLVSAGMVAAYFCFLMATDEFSRYFFLQNTIGKILLIFMILVIFCVLAFITTIKSKAI